ncbi:tRNA (adenosine(37)-N6)-threonylcarbamoyltransferase complex ATPase subunit type 1 TsaE [Oceanivirga miroungae]|uniref:tRNA threonylcarbamoyladenosine biosynthesis protein TsaE n=1 Tax=Oceanivirga miroungae TaxID=1130046 RepID=A0A6I8MCJ7_9FUSO|nr:tRNA (adenosine(37)-N6)-threonylcarbamoyltransferase complex ATPase subunit type 1 TsaE [Oceanivirga miroungae]VWL85202.1 tRNA threonylcarbamoyladenosine biosynthesis protein TsaE [Oceanivirga miroungae]
MLLNKTELSFEKFNELVENFSKRILENKKNSICIGLIGDLGTGKTAFSKKLLSSLGVTEYVKSPTFTYLIEYNIDGIDIYHFDVYRISNEDELYNIGFYDYIDNNNSLVLVEWANLILDEMPKNTIYFEIEHSKENTRIYSSYIIDKGEKIYVDVYNYKFD